MQSAPLLDLDVPSLISIEYPLHIRRNAESRSKAIQMLSGGATKLQKCFIDPDMKLELRLRPGDVNSHPLRSSVIKNSENVLVKFRIPKKVRKMFPGSDVRSALKYCEEHGLKYHVEPTGILKQNYKFRELADFQILTRGSQFMGKFNESIQRGDFKRIEEFSANLATSMSEDRIQSFSNGDLDIPPLVRYARIDIPFNYHYSGNLLLDSTGEWLDKAVKLYPTQIQWGETIPQHHDSRLDEQYERALADVAKMRELGISEKMINESVPKHFLECLKILKKLFEMKPIWIRRHIHWLLPKELRSQLRFTLPYVSYTFAKGPFRHSFLRYGYDPAKHSESWKYQIEAFRGSGNANHDSEIEKFLEVGGANGDTVSGTGTGGNGNGNGNGHVDGGINEMWVIPRTLYEWIDEFSDPNSEINQLGIGKVPRQLLFDGKNTCNALAFQLEDIMDEDVMKLLNGSPRRDSCSVESGWIELSTLVKIRNVMKYKLNCLGEGGVINEDRVQELMSKNMTSKVRRGDEEQGQEQGQGQGQGQEQEQEQEQEVEGEYEPEAALGQTQKLDDEIEPTQEGEAAEIAPDDILQRLERLNPKSANIMQDIDKIVRQESVMADELVMPE
jgi:general transcription factor 3C polypeptide 5 (transcription factor C subunit 1)